jgi:hypothetical protein
MFHLHVLGYVVRRLRELAQTGASPNSLLEYLRNRCGSNDRLQYEYLQAAFFPRIPGAPFTFLVPPSAPLTADGERSVGDLISRHKDVWSVQPYPELARVRDYVAYLEFARDENVILTVCASNPFSGNRIDDARFRSYRGDLFVTSSKVGPWQGLISADPTDARLIHALTKYTPALSYEDYVTRLERSGYRVRSARESYLLEDRDGRALYEGYRLHGVYDAATSSPVWTAKRGEQLRAALNRRLGQQLVHFGPHDQWEHRDDPAVAGPLSGPQLPAIAFSPDGEIDALLTVEDMGWGIPQIAQHWGRLYPHHPVTR